MPAAHCAEAGGTAAAVGQRLMHYVIGSGPAGIACASALQARGEAVTIIDAGLQLEPEREAIRAGMAFKSKAAWNAAERLLVSPRVSKDAVPDKLVYGSDYPYRGSAPGSLRGSFAQGGLSNVWGGVIMPYRAQDIADWPISLAALEPGYKAAMKLLPMAAEMDGLATEWPLYGTPDGNLPRGRQATRLLNTARANAAKLAAQGVRLGASRLAVHPQPCILCGACLNGCPRALIYSTRETLAQLRAAGTAYISGITVHSIEETDGAVRIQARDAAGAPRQFTGERAYLAAGVLNSAEIMLRSLRRSTATLLDSQYFLVPWLQLRGSHAVRLEALHSMAQLFVEIDDPAISPFGVHLQIYGYNDVIAATLASKLGKLASLFPSGLLLDRMLVIQGYLHSAHSSRIALKLEDDRLRTTPVLNPETPAKIAAILRKLRKLAPLVKAYPLAPLLQFTEPGRGFHSAGSFPMAANPKPGQTDILGRPPGWRRSHLVDASILPSIAATTITLTAMANAWRIGDAVAAEGAV